MESTRRREQRRLLLLLVLLAKSSSGFVLRKGGSFLGPARIPAVNQGLTSSRLRPLSMAVGKTGGKNIQTEDEFVSTVSSDLLPTLCFYTAPWCGPCRLSIPVVKDVIKEFAGLIDVVEICTDDLPEVAENAGVVNIPTIQMYYEGRLYDTIVGCVATNVLASAVRKVLEETVGLTTTE
uniref:Thioredoxin domain-containing protein n=1 Tax=Grammatophora oceanica TaxID=210454 RepID=A0A7S1YJW1_9STRA|mmetsp:Transcript_50629/g.75675  ORF Transcript_50629/g.75675 Transcript_50629/m.75675 type:complete len:179 (+) Transcript_50629:247-783(+)